MIRLVISQLGDRMEKHQCWHSHFSTLEVSTNFGFSSKSCLFCLVYSKPVRFSSFQAGKMFWRRKFHCFIRRILHVPKRNKALLNGQFPFQLNLKLRKWVSKAGKDIPKLVRSEGLVAKYWNYGKHSSVKFAKFMYKLVLRAKKPYHIFITYNFI